MNKLLIPLLIFTASFAFAKEGIVLKVPHVNWAVNLNSDKYISLANNMAEFQNVVAAVYKDEQVMIVANLQKINNASSSESCRKQHWNRISKNLKNKNKKLYNKGKFAVLEHVEKTSDTEKVQNFYAYYGKDNYCFIGSFSYFQDDTFKNFHKFLNDIKIINDTKNGYFSGNYLIRAGKSFNVTLPIRTDFRYNIKRAELGDAFTFKKEEGKLLIYINDSMTGDTAVILIGDVSSTQKDLKSRLAILAERYIDDSVERKINIKNRKNGYYYNITDKTTDETDDEDYKYIIGGATSVGDSTVIYDILTNNKKSKTIDEIFKIVDSIKVEDM